MLLKYVPVLHVAESSTDAPMVKLVNTRHLKCLANRLTGSIPVGGTKQPYNTVQRRPVTQDIARGLAFFTSNDIYTFLRVTLRVTQ